MKFSWIIFIAVMVFILPCLADEISAATPAAQPETGGHGAECAMPGDGTPAIPAEQSRDAVPPDSSNADYLVYYFHLTHRCSSCKTIEKYTQKTLNTYFPQQLKSGTIAWKTFNLEAPENADLTRQFKLEFNALIIARQKDGKIVGHKDLEDIWTLLKDETAFIDYVKKELAAFMAP